MNSIVADHLININVQFENYYFISQEFKSKIVCVSTLILLYVTRASQCNLIYFFPPFPYRINTT